MIWQESSKNFDNKICSTLRAGVFKKISELRIQKMGLLIIFFSSEFGDVVLHFHQI